MQSCYSTIVLAFAVVSTEGQQFEHTGKIETTINPSGTYAVTLAPMPIRGTSCDLTSVALSARLITRQYSQLWRHNSPEVVYLSLLSPNRDLFADGINIETPQNRKEFAAVVRPGRQLPGCQEWKHTIALTRNQFLWIANAATVRADGANADAVVLKRDHIEALRDLASRMEPEESVVTPPDPEVFSFEGDLRPGLAYLSHVEYKDGGWWPVEPPVRIPMHHAMRLEWVNLSEFPALSAKKPSRQEVIFVVVERKVAPMGPNRWNTTILCKVLRVR